MIYKCRKCNKEYSRKNHLKIHINKCNNGTKLENEYEYLLANVNYNELTLKSAIDDYKAGYSIQDILKKYNINLRIYTQLLGINRSNSESKKTKIYKEKFEKTNLEKYGVTHPSKLDWVKKKKENTNLKNTGYRYTLCDKVIRENAIKRINYKTAQDTMVKNLQMKYGKHITNPTQIPGVSEKISKTKKLQYLKYTREEKRKMTEHCRSFVKYISKLELRIQNILNELDITYTANAFLYSYNFDIVFKNKIILEIQGDFWHGNPAIYNENDILLQGLTASDVWKKDIKKKEKLEENGYKIHYLWESTMNEMTDDDIIEYIKNILK